MKMSLKEFTEITSYLKYAPNRRELKPNDCPKDYYAAYVKSVLRKEDVITQEVDKAVALAMQSNNIPIEKIAAALTYSPNLDEKTGEEIIKESFIKEVLYERSIKEYEVEKYLNEVIVCEDKTDSRYQEYYRRAKNWLNIEKNLTKDVDVKIIRELDSEGWTSPYITEVLKYSPNFKGKTLREINLSIRKKLFLDPVFDALIITVLLAGFTDGIMSLTFYNNYWKILEAGGALVALFLYYKLITKTGRKIFQKD